MTERNDSLVAEYLARASRAMADLPADRRDELVSDLREHIATSRADLPVETEAQVRGILERLGDPAVIARAAAEDAGPPSASVGRSGAVDERPMPGAGRGRRLWLVVGVVVLLALVVAVLFFAQSSDGGPATTLIGT